jgi:cbb3-type cytochrome oxidase subunit 1
MFEKFRPPLFLVTALLWLAASVLLGLYAWIARETGWPVPPQLRVIHVHMALVGGVAQMIFGAMLTFIPPLLMVPFEEKRSRGIQYVLLNGGAAGLLVGFGLADLPLVGMFGAAVGLAFLMLFAETLRMVRASIQRTGLNLWFYGLAVLALLAGIGLAEAIAFGVFTPDRVNLARLAHLHLNLLGFVTLTIVGTMHNMFPTVCGARLHSQRLALATFVTLPLGVFALVGGFILAEPPAQILAGFVLLAGVLCYGWNIFRTWLAAETTQSLPVLHLLCATGWLLLTMAGGVFLAWNSRTNPPEVPIGTAHLMGYSHTALVGFMLQTIMGALSHLLPVILTLNRVKSQKKRRPYLDRLTGLIEQGKWIQLAALNLGIAAMIGWGLSASLSGLRTEPTVAILWTAAMLLLAGLGLFAGKVVRLLASSPSEQD